MSIRRLRPSELARQDQHEAAAAEIARQDPDVIVIMHVVPSDDAECCWCDCSDRDAPAVCDSPCGDEAQIVIQVFHGMPWQFDLPVCAEHHRDLDRYVDTWLQEKYGPLPTEVDYIDVLDEGVA